MTHNENEMMVFKISYHISYNDKYFCCCGKSVNIYDRSTRKLVAYFKGMNGPVFSKFISDSRLIVRNENSYLILDIDTKEIVKKLKLPRGSRGANTDFLITPDNKTIVAFAGFFPYYQLMMMDIETGQYSLYDLDETRTGDLFYDDTKSEYYISAFKNRMVNGSDNPKTEFYSLKYPFDTVTLHKLPINKYHNTSKIDYNCGKFAIAKYNKKIRSEEICIYDMELGTEKRFCCDIDGVLYDLKLSQSCKYIAVVEAFLVRIFELETNTCIKSFDTNYACFAEFIDDDTKLLIGTWEKGYCVDLSFESSETVILN